MPWLQAYGNWYVWAAAVGGLALLAALGGWALRRRWTAPSRQIQRTLENIADRLLRHVLLPDGMGGYVAVDALLLRDGRLYVLDIRDLEGAIFAGEKLDVWTAIGSGRRFTFNNPLRAMPERSAALRVLAPELPLEFRILFTGGSHFPKGRPPGVELLEEFAAPLRRDPKACVPDLAAPVRAAWERVCGAVETPPRTRSSRLTRRSQGSPAA